MELVQIFQTMHRIFVICFSFCLPSSSVAEPAAATDDDGKQKQSSSANFDADHVTMEVNDKNDEPQLPINNGNQTMEINDNNDKPRPPINNTRALAVMTGIGVLFQEHEIGKMTMGFVVAAIVVLLIHGSAFPSLALNLVLISFSVGFVIIWNGIMLRDRFHRFCSVTEQVGVVIVFIGFFSLVAAVLPLSLVWAPVLCGLVFLLPFLLSHCIFCGNNTAADLLPVTAMLPTGGLDGLPASLKKQEQE